MKHNTSYTITESCVVTMIAFLYKHYITVLAMLLAWDFFMLSCEFFYPRSFEIQKKGHGNTVYIRFGLLFRLVC